ncbi:STAS domain-containing protein [Streptomyces tanashiensis]|uniref:STAS domain-containing protein n=1 Tax=Streptomyces tanashiensis TaxID=67367 RepID=UPI0034083396
MHDSGADNAPGVIVIDSVTTLGITLVVCLVGEIDGHSVAPLRALLASAAADGYTGLVVDTARVTLCDASLLAALGWWSRQGRRLTLVNRSGGVPRSQYAACPGQSAPRAGSLTAAAAS